MKAVRACFMAAVSAIVGAIPEVVGAVGAQSLSKINDLQSMSDRFIGGSLLLRRCNMQTPAYLDVALQHGGG